MFVKELQNNIHQLASRLDQIRPINNLLKSYKFTHCLFQIYPLSGWFWSINRLRYRWSAACSGIVSKYQETGRWGPKGETVHPDRLGRCDDAAEGSESFKSWRNNTWFQSIQPTKHTKYSKDKTTCWIHLATDLHRWCCFLWKNQVLIRVNLCESVAKTQY